MPPLSECAELRADVPRQVHGVAAQRAAGPPRANHLEGALRERAGCADRDAHQQRLGRLYVDGFGAGLLAGDVVELGHGVGLHDDLRGRRIPAEAQGARAELRVERLLERVVVDELDGC